MLPGPGFSRYGFSSSAVPTCLAKECLSATLDRTKLVSRPVPVRGQVRFRAALAELLRRQGEALGPNSWNGTSLTQVVLPCGTLDKLPRTRQVFDKYRDKCVVSKITGC